MDIALKSKFFKGKMFYIYKIKMNKSIFKELFIILLLIAVIIFTISILFYDSLSVDIKEIESIENISSKNIDKMLEEAKIEPIKEEDKTEKYTRKVTEEEIEKYLSENSSKGKKNPFVDYSNNKNKSANATKKNNEGSFFENKSSK